MSESAYVRPQWTGKSLVYSDGKVDTEWAQCPSCLGYHHASSRSCNGKREPCVTRCLAVLAEAVRCDRPSNHLGEHDAIAQDVRVRWGAA